MRHGTGRSVGTPDRCGYGQRLPLLVISPYAQENYVGHNLTDTASMLSSSRTTGCAAQRIGGGSFDAIAGSLDGRGGVLDFHTRPHFTPLILNPTTGEVVRH